mmetsp:Transcript_1323/g.3613  ORF Transcript_1323/g.3613 Transcript_1323/m.3613 type:complete len:272 (-) Transcript_1323:472-1287(-)
MICMQALIHGLVLQWTRNLPHAHGQSEGCPRALGVARARLNSGLRLPAAAQHRIHGIRQRLRLLGANFYFGLLVLLLPHHDRLGTVLARLLPLPRLLLNRLPRPVTLSHLIPEGRGWHHRERLELRRLGHPPRVRHCNGSIVHLPRPVHRWPNVDQYALHCLPIVHVGHGRVGVRPRRRFVVVVINDVTDLRPVRPQDCPIMPVEGEGMAQNPGLEASLGSQVRRPAHESKQLRPGSLLLPGGVGYGFPLQYFGPGLFVHVVVKCDDRLHD